MGIHFREQDSFVRIVELTPAMRKQIEATIEHLIAILDRYDGDENREEDDAGEDGGDAEPSLGWTDSETRSGRHAVVSAPCHPTHYHSDDLVDCELDTADREPTLGAPERPVFCGMTWQGSRDRTGNQDHWADGRRGDHEREEENEHGGNILDVPHDGGE